MEGGNESRSNNGVPRFWSIRIVGVDLTMADNGASPQRRPHQPLQLQVQIFPITELRCLPGSHQPLINFFGSHSSTSVGQTSSGLVADQPNSDQTNSDDVNHSRANVLNMEMDVEINVLESFGGEVDPDVMDILRERVDDMLEELQSRVDHDLLNVHFSVEIEEILEPFDPQQQPVLITTNQGLSDDVILNHLGEYETSFEDNESCSICLSEFSTGHVLGKINCEHKYHFTCIMQWLKYNNICPFCRAIALHV